jgi:hypothetical protein
MAIQQHKIDLSEALRLARAHLITLGGDPRGDANGDKIQAAVLDEIDNALAGKPIAGRG